MISGFLQKVLSIFLPALLLLASLQGYALASSDEDMQTLGMYYEAKDLVVTATRNPKPISQTAENITIITAKEIEMMGAHTLVDVFANVPGIQASDQGGPGTNNDFIIWGARGEKHILLMVDGVTLNTQEDQFVDLRGIPIQNIERIEIVKGPGSSSWGSALGGVVNIVTKSPFEGKKLGGKLSFSGGENDTQDSRGEISGTVGPLGYYLFAGNLSSNGFRPNTTVDLNDIYAKLRLELPNQGSLQFTIAYDKGHMGNGDGSMFGFLDRLYQENFFSTLSLNYPINDKIDLDLSLRTRYLKTKDMGRFLVDDPDNGIATGDTFNFMGSETTYGGSARLTWRGRMNTLAAGADYDNVGIYGNLRFIEDTTEERLGSDKYGIFLNDTLAIGDFAITPGIRYDWMRQVGDFFSPSLGVAWNPTEKITLRTYWARGYSLPEITSNSKQQKVMTVQAGVETTYIPWLWLKGTFFWNRLTDIQNFNTGTLDKQIKQGVEVEGKTVPIFNTSLSAGYTFIDSKDEVTGETLQNLPRQLVKLGIYYDDIQHTLKGSLLGRYGWLNASADRNARYTAIIWDLCIAKKVLHYKGTDLELFFNVHNIFNGSQYSTELFKNTRRWVEGGIKFEF
jgi:vitamin B12 transporter